MGKKIVVLGLAVVTSWLIYVNCNRPLKIFDQKYIQTRIREVTTSEKILAQNNARESRKFLEGAIPKYDKAKKELIKSLLLYPDPYNYLQLGNVMMLDGDNENAYHAFLAAIDVIKMSPSRYYKVTDYYYKTACAASRTKRKAETLRYLELLLEDNYDDFDQLREERDLSWVRSFGDFELLLSRYQKSLSQNEEELIGIWQEIPDMAEGWAENYRFFKNGKYRREFNTMDDTKRDLWEAGKWNAQERALYIEIFSKETIEGGELKYFPVSENGPEHHEYLGGVRRIIILNPPIKKSRSLSKIELDPRTGKNIIRIENKKYWKMQNDANDY